MMRAAAAQISKMSMTNTPRALRGSAAAAATLSASKISDLMGPISENLAANHRQTQPRRVLSHARIYNDASFHDALGVRMNHTLVAMSSLIVIDEEDYKRRGALSACVHNA